MASSTGEEQPCSPVVSTAPPVAMESEMISATGCDHCKVSTPPKPPAAAMDCRLLASACSGSFQDLKSLLSGEDREGSRNGTIGSSADDEEAFLRDSVRLLDGVTVGGDTALHVVAAYGDCEEFVSKAHLILSKAGDLLFVQNDNGDTPLHCAVRVGYLPMVSLLIDHAKGLDDNANRVKELLQTENKSKWTVLHEAVRIAIYDIVRLLMMEDPQLASFPHDGTSPLFLAILMENQIIAKTLYELSGGVLSYSGPNGQNALHAAVHRGEADLTEMLLGWNNTLMIHQDENGSTPLHFAVRRRKICSCLLEANPCALYLPDKDGSFPTHVAASRGATRVITDFLHKSPRCAGLRDARGRTFLHVAVDEMETGTVSFACKNQSLSWILNMQDNDGNTALHLAMQKGSVKLFGALIGNIKVKLDLTNKKGETPRDIASHRFPEGLYHEQDSEAIILSALDLVEAESGHLGYFRKKDIVKESQDKIILMERIRDSTQNLSIGSVLIATVTFGATFAMPGGYRADDHTNGGTPTLARRYAFDAFILANAVAFAFSMMTTVGLMSSGSPLLTTRSRVRHFLMASNLMQISVTCLVAAFALGTYAMLAPVAHMVAVAVCVLSSLVLLYVRQEVALKNAILGPALFRRLGIRDKIVVIFPLSAFSYVAGILSQLWPIVVIFALAALKYVGNKVEPAVQPPTPLP